MDANSEYDEVINELKAQWDVENLLGFNEMDIQEKLSVNSAKIWHFTELYNREKNDLDGIIELRDKLVCKRYEYYKTNADLLLKQSEIEKYYLPKDPEIIRMNNIVRKQKWRVEFYLGLKLALEKQGWNMMNFIKNVNNGL